MKKVLIHCAMEKEAKKIAEKLNLKSKIEDKIEHIYEGKTEETIVNLTVTGIGKQKTAIGLMHYIDKFEKPDIIINVGYAGSSNSKIGSWINISKSYNLEWFIPGEEKFSLDIGNQKLVRIEGMESLPCYSAECFVTKTDMKENVVFDMELNSVCLIADIYNIPVLSLKMISDNLSLDNYYKNIQLEEVKSLDTVTEYLTKYIK